MLSGWAHCERCKSGTEFGLKENIRIKCCRLQKARGKWWAVRLYNLWDITPFDFIAWKSPFHGETRSSARSPKTAWQWSLPFQLLGSIRDVWYVVWHELRFKSVELKRPGMPKAHRVALIYCGRPSISRMHEQYIYSTLFLIRTQTPLLRVTESA